jgi:hypothetical protein
MIWGLKTVSICIRMAQEKENGMTPIVTATMDTFANLKHTDVSFNKQAAPLYVKVLFHSSQKQLAASMRVLASSQVNFHTSSSRVTNLRNFCTMAAALIRRLLLLYFI